MIDCFTAGKVRDGMRALHGLLEDRDAALGIASFLESRFKLMLEGRKLMDGGLSAQTAAAKLEGNRYANTKACTAAKILIGKACGACRKPCKRRLRRCLGRRCRCRCA